MTSAELHHVLYVENCDCVLVTETWLNEDIANGLLDPKSHYNIVRKDRSPSGRGGGVCVMILCLSLLIKNSHDPS